MKEIIVTSNVPSADIGKLDKLTEVSIADLKASSIIVAQTTSVEDPSFNVKVNNYGEDLQRQPALFKYNQDTALSVDYFIKTANKNINELVNKAESLSFNIGKPQQDMLISFDSITLQSDIQRIFLETVSKAEYIALLSAKGVSDNGSISESLSKGIQPSFQELKTLSETFDRLVNYNISLYDNAQSSDDFYGLANIDDDQVAAVQKNLVELSITGEILNFDLSNNYIESFSKVDTFSISPNKSVIDTTSIYGELFQLSFNKGYDEILDNADIISLGISPNFVDNESMSDIVNFISNTVINDIENTNETLNLSTDKALLDNFTNIDNVNTLTGLNKNEQVSKSDSGLINNQGYFSSNYIIPGYVGTNTSF